MNLNDFFQNALFSIGNIEITVGKTLAFLLVILALVFFWRLAHRRAFPYYFQRESLSDEEQKRVKRAFNLSILLLGVLLSVLLLGVNLDLYRYNDQITLTLSDLLLGLWVWQLVRLANIMISKILLEKYYQKRDEKKQKQAEARKDVLKSARRTAQYIIYVLALILIINSLDLNYTFFQFTYKGNSFDLRVSNFLAAALVVLCARLFSWMLIQLVLHGYYQRKDINIGSQAAINQLLQYVIYIAAVLMAFDRLGVDLTLLWAGAGALLIGIGIGLQQTVSDFFAGLLLLFDRSVEVGDVLEVEGLVGTVKKIGLRSSQIQTRDNITVIIPNSNLTSEKVINWSHFDNRARFSIGVGVAYGSDTRLVKKLLLKVVNAHKSVLKYPPPFVRFTNFGDSSLDFEVLFWSKEFIRIEDVKSDLRFEIDQIFRENNINIPFPQRDVWMRKE